MKNLVVLILVMCCNSIVAQQSVKTSEMPHFSIRANIGIPKVVTSSALRNSFSGVVTPDLSLNYKLFSGFFVGVGYSYTYFQAQKYFRDRSINTNMQMQNGYIKVGYDKFISNTAFTTIALNAGFGNTKFEGIAYKHDSLIGKFPTNFNSGYIEPSFGINFLVDPNFAFGGFISYHYNFAPFNPSYSNLDKWYNYAGITNKWNTSLITLGFGFYYGIGK